MAERGRAQVPPDPTCARRPDTHAQTHKHMFTCATRRPHVHTLAHSHTTLERAHVQMYTSTRVPSVLK